jgi:hypothetical protein
MRFQELDSEDDDSDHGVGLGIEEFTSDALRFDGADTSRRYSRNREEYSVDEEEGSEEEYALIKASSGVSKQFALREKEEVLYRRAVDRIRRAEELGQSTVDLTEPERQAFERKTQMDLAIAKPAKKSSSPKLKDKKSGERPSSSKSAKPLSGASSRKASKASLKPSDSPPKLSGGPGLLVPGPDGQPLYAPLGYYSTLPSSASSSRTSSRANSMQQASHPGPAYYGPPKRYFSGPEQYYGPPPYQNASPRTMQEDMGWQQQAPPSRSSSNIAYPPTEHFPQPGQYQSYAPPPSQQQYSNSSSQGRRIVSTPAGAAEVDYPSIRPLRGSLGTHANSDPALRTMRRTSAPVAEGGTSSEESESSDDDGQGVQVTVEERRGTGYAVRTSPMVQQSGFAGGGSGRQRKGRR